MVSHPGPSPSPSSSPSSSLRLCLYFGIWSLSCVPQTEMACPPRGPSGPAHTPPPPSLPVSSCLALFSCFLSSFSIVSIAHSLFAFVSLFPALPLLPLFVCPPNNNPRSENTFKHVCVVCVRKKGGRGVKGACLPAFVCICVLRCVRVHARACVSTCANARARAHDVYACTSRNHPSTHRMRAAACGHACVRLLTHDVPLLHPPCFWTIEQISANRSSDSRSVQWQVSALLEPELGRGSMVRVTQGHWSAYPLHENQ